MRVTLVLLKQHIGRMTRRHWIVQGKRYPLDTGAEKILIEKGIPVYDPQILLNEKKPLERINVVGVAPKEVKFDNTHPDWHNTPCFTYKDNNFLLEGLTQAKVITKSIDIQEGLPTDYDYPQSSKEIDTRVLKIIASAHLYDPEQVKLPKIKDPQRPAWNFPRTYGISDIRRNGVLTSKLIGLIERLSPAQANNYCLIDKAHFMYTFEKGNDLFQLQLRADKLLTCKDPLNEKTTLYTDNIELPDLFPLKQTISIPTENIYKNNVVYPIDLNFSKSHPHTIFVHYNKTEVNNLYEEPATEDQILGLSLMKTFAVAASYARTKFGEDSKVLPKPVTVQCIQTDGQFFHFGVLQLNTLDLAADNGVKNIWYHKARIPLFTECRYDLGKPVFHGYNSEVITHLLAFYNKS